MVTNRKTPLPMRLRDLTVPGTVYTRDELAALLDIDISYGKGNVVHRNGQHAHLMRAVNMLVAEKVLHPMPHHGLQNPQAYRRLIVATVEVPKQGRYNNA
jgi:hypothetical protein